MLTTTTMPTTMPSTPPMNTYTDWFEGSGPRFYRIGVDFP